MVNYHIRGQGSAPLPPAYHGGPNKCRRTNLCEVITVGCEELAAERCPCLLAETEECPYCGLLRGEKVCACDWQGRCAFERCRWPEGTEGDRPAGTVVAVRVLDGATGLILRGDEQLAAAPAGTLVTFRLPLAGSRERSAILLRTYPSGLVYLLSLEPLPGELLLGRAITPVPAGNAFAGYQTLAAAENCLVAILAAAPLAALLAPLAAGLRARGCRVTVAPPGAAGTVPDAAIIFAAGGENEIKRMATALPSSFRGLVVTWVTGGR
jgi:hypothetical protein